MRSFGFDINPPIEGPALEAGDTYSFIYGTEEFHCIYDGSEWRVESILKYTTLRTKYDPEVVTIL